MSWSRYNWRDNGILPVALALLRTCCLWPWAELLRRWLAPAHTAQILPLLLMLGIFLAALVTARLSLAGKGSLAVPRLLATGAGLVALLLLLWWQLYRPAYALWDVRWLPGLGAELVNWGAQVPPALLTLLATAYLWLQGLLDGARPINTDDAWNAFSTGFISLAVCMLASTLDRQGPPPGTLGLVLLFFAAGMAALAVCSLQLARGPRLTEGEVTVSAGRYWLSSVTVVIGLIVGSGVLISIVLAPEAMAQALRWTGVLLDLVARALFYVLLPFVYVAFLLLEPLLRWLQMRIRESGIAEALRMPDLQRELEELQTNAPQLSPALGEALRWAALGALALAIAVAFALALRRLRRRDKEGVEETRETVFSRDLLEEQLGNIWKDMLRRLRRRRTSVPDPFLSLEHEVPTRRSIRAVYQALLAAAKERGQVRRRGETPAEYQRGLAQALPTTGEALRTITARYEQARYAPDDPTPAQAAETIQAWAQASPLWSIDSEP